MVAQQRRNPTGELNRSANQTSQGRIQKSTSRKKNYYPNEGSPNTIRREENQDLEAREKKLGRDNTNARKEMPVKKGTLWWMTYMRCAQKNASNGDQDITNFTLPYLNYQDTQLLTMVGGLHYYQTAVDLLRDYYPTTTSVAILETYCMVKGKEKVLQNIHPHTPALIIASSQADTHFPLSKLPTQNFHAHTYHYYPGTQPSTLGTKSLSKTILSCTSTTSTAHIATPFNPTKSFCKISRLNSFSRPPQQ